MAAHEYLTVERPTTKELTRLFSKVRIDGDCWVWVGSHDQGGYGNLTFRKRYESAHRVFYAWLVGALPRGNSARYESQLDHLCRRRDCVNPAHLERVSQPTNVLRGSSPSATHARKTHCKNGHPLPLHPTPRRNDPSRRERTCAICKDAYEKARAIEHRAAHKARMEGPRREELLRKHRDRERVRRQLRKIQSAAARIPGTVRPSSPIQGPNPSQSSLPYIADS